MQAGDVITPRPRPPAATRRATSKLSAPDPPPSFLTTPAKMNATLGRSSSGSSTIIPDLDLDLPEGLAAALERNIRPQLGTRRTRLVSDSIVSQGDEEGRGAATQIGMSSQTPLSTRGGSVGGKTATNLRKGNGDVFDDDVVKTDPHHYFRLREHSEAATQNKSDRSRSTSEGSSSAAISSAKESSRSSAKKVRTERNEADLSRRLDEGNNSLDSVVAEAHEREWVGGLPREELEDLLVQAQAVIRERERDLGIAAAIGKALLDKNLSLRSKHASVSERLRMVSAEGDASAASVSSPPPNTDRDHHRSASAATSDDVQSSARTENAREGDQDSHDSLTPKNTLDSPFKQTPFPSYWSGGGNSSQHIASAQDPSVHSPMASPLARKSAPRHETTILRPQGQTPSGSPFYYSGESQRRYAALMEQNDALHAQLSELQSEAEINKRAGGQKLRTLNREIEGLRLELEAATARNEELEKSKQESVMAAGPIWKRKGRGQFAFARAATPDDDGERYRDCDATLRQPSVVRTCASSSADSGHSASPSVHSITDSMASETESSELSPLSNNPDEALAEALATASAGPSSDEQHTLVAQLLAKIQELEDTNAAMARAGSEMDGRIGRAIEEGARIQDAYEAVERADAESSFCGEDDRVEGSAGASAGYFHAGTEATTARRRAPGNRYMIEGRRTVRAALRLQRLEAAGLQGDLSSMTRSETTGPLTSFSVSSASSSSSAARRRRRSAGGSVRPCVRVTSSFDDLYGRQRQVAVEENSLSGHDSVAATQRQFQRAQPERPTHDAEVVGAAFSHTLRRVLSSASIASSSMSLRAPGSVRPSLSSVNFGSYADDGQIDDDGSVDWTPSAARRLSFGFGERWPLHHTLPSHSAAAPGLAGGPTLKTELTLSTGFSGIPGQWSEDDFHLADLVHRRRGSTVSLAPPIFDGPTSCSLRRQSSVSSLADTIASDIADLRFSTSASGSHISISPDESTMHQATDTDPDGPDGRSGIVDVLAPVSFVGEALRTATADGQFPDSADILPLGALRDGSMTNADSYEAIERAATRAPVIWADDEDFGKPITQSEARRLGLLEKVRDKRGGLLNWLPGVPGNRAEAKPRRSGKALQDTQTLLEEQELEQLLRNKRAEALRTRAEVRSGSERSRLRSLQWRQASEESSVDSQRRAHTNYPLTRPRPSWSSSSKERSFNSETTVRALSISPARARRAQKLMDFHEREMHERIRGAADGLSPSKIALEGIAFPMNEVIEDDSTTSGKTPATSLKGYSPLHAQGSSEHSQVRTPSTSTGGYTPDDDPVNAGDDFELVELDAVQHRSRRGTDYFPVSRRARLRPDIVRQRVQVASAEAIMWITAWITFASVLVFAFAVAFSRGPKTILGPSTTSLKRQTRRR